MKFSTDKPPIYEKLHELYGIEWNHGIIITYGDTIHSKFPLDIDKQKHEAVHVKQQLAYGVEEWWNEYIKNEDFRLSQELEAYAAEKHFIQSSSIDRNKKVQLIDRIYRDLSSSVYGNIISYSKAKEALQ